MARSAMIVALITSLLLVVTSIPASYGHLQSSASDIAQVQSGGWGASISTQTGAATNAPYLLTWTANKNRQYALIALVNTGSYNLGAGHISISSAKSNGDTTNPPTLTFETCSGAWSATSYACSGSITTIASAASGQIDFSQNIAVGNRLVIRVTNLRDINANYLTTINALSFRADIRVAEVLSS
ncbi:MAG: hypothetical protein RL202_2 [Actinomycetota bacterium]|jgi:hypothetical protein